MQSAQDFRQQTDSLHGDIAKLVPCWAHSGGNSDFNSASELQGSVSGEMGGPEKKTDMAAESTSWLSNKNIQARTLPRAHHQPVKKLEQNKIAKQIQETDVCQHHATFTTSRCVNSKIYDSILEMLMTNEDLSANKVEEITELLSSEMSIANQLNNNL
jgi:hypothetical protein